DAANQQLEVAIRPPPWAQHQWAGQASRESVWIERFQVGQQLRQIWSDEQSVQITRRRVFLRRKHGINERVEGHWLAAIDMHRHRSEALLEVFRRPAGQRGATMSRLLHDNGSVHGDVLAHEG